MIITTIQVEGLAKRVMVDSPDALIRAFQKAGILADSGKLEQQATAPPIEIIWGLQQDLTQLSELTHTQNRSAQTSNNVIHILLQWLEISGDRYKDLTVTIFVLFIIGWTLHILGMIFPGLQWIMPVLTLLFVLLLAALATWRWFRWTLPEKQQQQQLNIQIAGIRRRMQQQLLDLEHYAFAYRFGYDAWIWIPPHKSMTAEQWELCQQRALCFRQNPQDYIDLFADPSSDSMEQKNKDE